MGREVGKTWKQLREGKNNQNTLCEKIINQKELFLIIHFFILCAVLLCLYICLYEAV